MKQRSQLNVKLKINISATRERRDKTHGKVVGSELALEE